MCLCYGNNFYGNQEHNLLQLKAVKYMYANTHACTHLKHPAEKKMEYTKNEEQRDIQIKWETLKQLIHDVIEC